MISLVHFYLSHTLLFLSRDLEKEPLQQKMFQRRMFLVASQLRNAQLSPQFRRRKGTQQQQ